MAAQKARFLCQNSKEYMDGSTCLYAYTFNAASDQGTPENNIWLVTPQGKLEVLGVKNIFKVGDTYEFTIKKLGES